MFGSYVTDGVLKRNGSVRVIRDSVVVADDTIQSLRRFKDDVAEVATGFECGVGLDKFQDIKVGDEFDGWVTGVSAFGLYIELIEHFVEGMVRVSTMADDYYRFIEKAHLLKGENTGKVYRLGDRVNVQVIRVDMERRQVDLGPWARRTPHCPVRWCRRCFRSFSCPRQDRAAVSGCRTCMAPPTWTLPMPGAGSMNAVP